MNGFVRRVKRPVRGLVRGLGKRFNVHHDAATGLLDERCFGHRVFLKSRQDHQHEHVYQWLCDDVYFSR